MRRIAALLLCLAVAGAGLAQQPASGGRVERPEVRAGDLWRYRVTDMYTNQTRTAAIEVTAVTGNRIETRTGAGAIEAWDRDWNQLTDGSLEYVPFYPTLQFPLDPGKRWSGAAQWRATSGIMTHKVTLEVTGWERIAVPAGTFDAVRIARRGNFAEAQTINYYAANGIVNDVIWYAPAVGQIVRKDIVHRDFSNTRYADLAERWELLEYRRH